MKIGKITKILPAVYETEDALLISGVHGIGKSEILEQWCKENGFHFEPLFLSHQDIGDIIGIPDKTERNGEVITTWASPSWLQKMERATFPDSYVTDIECKDPEFKKILEEKFKSKISIDTLVQEYNIYMDSNLTINEFLSKDLGIYSKNGKPCTLFLDELNRAQKEPRDLGLQLVQTRKFHQHALPSFRGKKCLIVSAVNPEDKYQVYEIDAALKDRFNWIEVEPDEEAWVEYARKKNLNNIVIDFIVTNPNYLHTFEGNDTVSSTPRSLESLSRYVDMFDDIPEDVRFNIIEGKIGPVVGSAFNIFYNSYVKIVKVQDIETVVDNIYPRSGFNVSVTAVKELLSETETTTKLDLAKKLEAKYSLVETRDEMITYLAFLYSLELEVRASYLKDFKTRIADRKAYINLSKLDFDKKMFIEIINLQEDTYGN